MAGKFFTTLFLHRKSSVAKYLRQFVTVDLDMWRNFRKKNVQNIAREPLSSISTSLGLTVAAAAFIANSNNDHNIIVGREESSPSSQNKQKDTEKSNVRNESKWSPLRMSQRSFVSCDSPKEPNQSPADITFRRRRLSINNTNVTISPEEAAETVHEEPISTDRSKMNKHRIMYSSEFESGDKSQTDENGNTKSPNGDDLDSSKPSPPFPSHQVGTYSCHGIEPQPYIVYDPPEHDTEITAFLRNMFIKSPTTDVSSRTKAKIVTVTKQKINQDRGHIIYPYDSDSQTALFGTYDGHGERGELLAEYTMDALCDKLLLHPEYQKSGKGRNIEKAFRDVLLEIDNEIKDIEDLSPLNSGSTACVVLMQGKRLYVANVGDSRAVLGSRRKPRISSKNRTVNAIDTIELTKDQNVHDKRERKRILKAGGYITIPQDKQLPARIWLDEQCSQVGLAMSRSIGDHALKHVGVIAEPVVQDYLLNDNDEFFILATDGVWEFVSSSEAVAIVDKCFQNGMDASDACKELIRVATEKWKEMEGDYRDDITAIVVRLDGIWEH